MADDDLLLSHRLASFPDRAVPSAPEGEKGNRPLSSEPARKRGAEAPLPVSWRPLPFPRPPPSWGGTSPEALPESGGEAPTPLRSEERRVGKEGRSRCARYHYTQ